MNTPMELCSQIPQCFFAHCIHLAGGFQLLFPNIRITYLFKKSKRENGSETRNTGKIRPYSVGQIRKPGSGRIVHYRPILCNYFFKRNCNCTNGMVQYM